MYFSGFRNCRGGSRGYTDRPLRGFWNDILRRVNKTSETLQNPRLDSFEKYVVKVAELDDFVEYNSESVK